MPIKISLSNRQIKSIVIALIMLFTSGATYVSNTSKSTHQTNKKPLPSIEINKQYEVVKVVDGDTFDVKVNNQIVKVRMLGMDTPTPGRDWKEVHNILLEKNTEIVLVEGLTYLKNVPDQFTFIGFPLNIHGRDGSPIRAVALVD